MKTVWFFQFLLYDLLGGIRPVINIGLIISHFKDSTLLSILCPMNHEASQCDLWVQALFLLFRDTRHSTSTSSRWFCPWPAVSSHACVCHYSAENSSETLQIFRYLVCIALSSPVLFPMSFSYLVHPRLSALFQVRESSRPHLGSPFSILQTRIFLKTASWISHRTHLICLHSFRNQSSSLHDIQYLKIIVSCIFFTYWLFKVGG